MTTALPDLWTDWCSITGVPAGGIDEASISRFARQAQPSRAVLAELRQRMAPKGPAAPAWPRDHREDTSSLQRLIRLGAAIIQHPGTHWVFRLRLRRMLFAAVLLASPSQGGLGLDRSGALEMRPDGMRRLRPTVGVAEDPASCPSCATWSWLDVIGTNSAWSRGSVRALGHVRWIIEFDNSRDTVLTAEGFVVALQIFLADIAPLNPVLIPSTVRINVEVHPRASGQDDQIDIDESQPEIVASVGLSNSGTEHETRGPTTLALCFQLLQSAHLRPADELQHLQEALFKGGIIHKVSIGRPVKRLRPYWTTITTPAAPVSNAIQSVMAALWGSRRAERTLRQSLRPGWWGPERALRLSV
ncbi:MULTISPECIES: hypothetical protein [Arthrobacter]|uniref:Uncharacterized protein n=1 Tax=Arthrobacter terricola TaxID=2547396 RepID=A0A4R5K8Z2_9MICC|nr:MULTISPECIES: hypothetical protein [Arthrobacter]MBT8163147.1 hypothetical protein [Arthrobacter sp. GN70]TDF91282.1 hypothetical protein E1809_21210 [Arthrobacter terricola]